MNPRTEFLSRKLMENGPDWLLILCPGCRRPHHVRRDEWDGACAEEPTFVKVQRQVGPNYACVVEIRLGHAKFLRGTTHQKAGETLPLGDIEEYYSG